MHDLNGHPSDRRALATAKRLGASALLLMLATVGAAPPSAPGPTHAPTADEGLSLTSMPLPSLERHYWACDRLIAGGMPTPAEFEQCSLVYETLKQRRFGGSTDEFAQWLRQRSRPASPDAARAKAPHA